MRFWILLFLLSPAVGAERFRLRFVRAADILPVLAESHSDLRFLPCPGGFKVHGSAGQLVAIRKEVGKLDVPQVEEWVEINHGERKEVISLLRTLVSEARIELSGDYHVTIRGGRHAVGQALELIGQLDQPLEKVTVECRVVLDDPEMMQFMGARWSGELMDEPPEVKVWERRAASDRLWTPYVGCADSPNFPKMAPWILFCSRLQALSGHEASFGVKEDGSELGVRWDVTASVKQDGYAILKLLPVVNDGLGQRAFTSDARVEFGETLVLAGLGRAEDLGLAGEGPILLLITVKKGW